MTITYPLTMPATPDFSSIRSVGQSVVATSISPFTRKSQKQVHQGDGWAFDLKLPPMTRAQAGAWIAFLLQCNGQEGTFYFGHAGTMTPIGTVGGTPVVDGAGQTGKVLNTRGWNPESGVLLAGDYIQIGTGATSRLYMNLVDVDASAASPEGAAALDIYPRLRESPADADSIVVSAPVGLFELLSNEMSWDIGEAVFYGLNFGIREAQ